MHKGKKKEFDETIEIALFGNRITNLTINEALFIIDPSNYIKDLKTFRENFKECKNKNINDIITPSSKVILTLLKINIDDLSDSNNKNYIMNPYINKSSQDNNIILHKEVLHPTEFYYKKSDKEPLDQILNYIDLIQEDMKKLK